MSLETTLLSVSQSFNKPNHFSADVTRKWHERIAEVDGGKHSRASHLNMSERRANLGKNGAGPRARIASH